MDILGEKPDIYVKEGSTLNLTCAIVSGGVNEPAAAAQIQWLKDGVEVEVMGYRNNYRDYNEEKWSRSSHGEMKNKNVHSHSSRHRAAKIAALRRSRRLKDADFGVEEHRSRRTRALSTAPPPAAPGFAPTPPTPILVTKPKLSRLIVLRATKQDSGVYKCVPPHGNDSRVFVHVIQGETRESLT